MTTLNNELRDIFHKNGLNYSQLMDGDTTSDTYVSMGIEGFNEVLSALEALIDSETREAREDELKRADKNAHKIGDYFKQRLRMIELDRLANLTKDYEYDDVRDTTAESKAKEARNKLKKKG